MNLREAAQQALEALEDSGLKADLISAADVLRAALASPTSQESKKVEPVAYVTGYFDGKCVIKPVNPVVLPNGMALYRSPPKREPLTDEEIREIADGGNYVAMTFADGAKGIALDKVTVCDLARAIEQAHGIGGEE